MGNCGYPSLVLIIAIICLLQEGTSIKCYDCSTETNRSCGDPFNETSYNQMLLRDCEHEKTTSMHILHDSISYCKKVKEIKNDNEEVITRSCAWGHSRDEDPCQSRNYNSYYGSNNKIVHCSVCESDRCNSAADNYAMALLTFIMAIVASKILK